MAWWLWQPLALISFLMIVSSGESMTSCSHPLLFHSNNMSAGHMAMLNKDYISLPLATFISCSQSSGQWAVSGRPTWQHLGIYLRAGWQACALCFSLIPFSYCCLQLSLWFLRTRLNVRDGGESSRATTQPLNCWRLAFYVKVNQVSFLG